jgi:hypothetical protein
MMARQTLGIRPLNLRQQLGGQLGGDEAIGLVSDIPCTPVGRYILCVTVVS